MLEKALLIPVNYYLICYLGRINTHVCLLLVDTGNSFYFPKYTGFLFGSGYYGSWLFLALALILMIHSGIQSM